MVITRRNEYPLELRTPRRIMISPRSTQPPTSPQVSAPLSSETSAEPSRESSYLINMIQQMSQVSKRVPIFNPESDEINDWIIAFEIATKGKEERRVDLLPTALKNKAFSWFASQHRVLNGEDRSWDQWKESLTIEFGRSSMAVLNELCNRRQKESESPKDYYQSVITLCSMANPLMSEVEKISHLLRGLTVSLREKMILMCPTSAKDFLEKMNMLNVSTPSSSKTDQSNLVELLAKALAEKQSIAPTLLNVDDKEISYLRKELKNLSQRMDELCQGNQHQGTFSRNTVRDDRSCHFCGIKGHFARDCRKKKREQSQGSNRYENKRYQRGSSPGRQGNGQGRW